MKKSRHANCEAEKALEIENEFDRQRWMRRKTQLKNFSSTIQNLLRKINPGKIGRAKLRKDGGNN